MNDIPGLSRPLADAGKRVDSWDDAGGQLVVVASSTVSRSTCPQCAGQSRQVHGRYRRRLADRACFGLPVTISIEIRRFKCCNASCAQRTFSESVGELATRSQRRTNRLTEGATPPWLRIGWRGASMFGNVSASHAAPRVFLDTTRSCAVATLVSHSNKSDGRWN
jgi:hypothetical protein